jgi:hypothetical protein
MNSRRLMKGRLGCLLFLIAPVLGTAPVALRAAVPSDAPPATATTDDTSNPYAVIVERNIFHLNPPPPPPEPDKPKIDLPVVKITGFVDIGNQSKALFVSEPKDKKAETAYYSLSEGEESSDGKLKLVKIHDAKDAVDVLNVGMPVTLTVKDDSLAPNAQAAAPDTKGPPPINPNNGIPGRQMFHPGRSTAPGIPGVPGVPGANGLSYPTRARHNLPSPP